MEGLVFLDFDGVICDSLLECLVSSWHAYYRLHLGENPKAVPRQLRSRFARLRPYVRAGEDFILIQELIHRGLGVASQQEFDAELDRRGSGLIAAYRRLFDSARRELLESHRRYWIGLNRLYPHARAALSLHGRSPCLYILSTKQAEYIGEILHAATVPVEPGRILSCGAKEKRGRIQETLENRGLGKALFIDDQIDHLLPAAGERFPVTGLLASWGYVKSEWLAEPRPVEVLRPEELTPRLSRWLPACPPGPRSEG